MRRALRVMAGLLTACLFFVCGCVSQWQQGMASIRRESIVSATWSGLELLGTEETEEKGWKPEPPSITHCYKLTIPVKEAYEKVIATAGEDGWSEDYAVQRETSRVVIKDTGEGVLNVILATDSITCEKYPDFAFRLTFSYR